MSDDTCHEPPTRRPRQFVIGRWPATGSIDTLLVQRADVGDDIEEVVAVQ